MKYRPLGTSGVQVSEVSFGCWTMGGLNWVNGSPNGWANVDEDEIVRAIKTGLDAGVNHFDNADVYGNGRAERMLARAFKKLGVKSTDYIVATKIGHFPGTAESRFRARAHPAPVRAVADQSRARLHRSLLLPSRQFRRGRPLSPGSRRDPGRAGQGGQGTAQGSVGLQPCGFREDCSGGQAGRVAVVGPRARRSIRPARITAGEIDGESMT